MNYLAVVITYMLKKLNNSRTAFGAYHILKGKKSAQTLQDCHLFGLSHFFGVSKDLNRDTFIKQLKLLEEQQLIKGNVENRYSVTKAGEKFLKRELLVNPIPKKLNGFEYKEVSLIFWKRLVLMIQCLSHLQVNKTNFIPIIKDGHVQLWVKHSLKKAELNNQQLAKQLYNEIEKLLKKSSTVCATLFVLKLSGSNRIGLTTEQAADHLNINRFYAKLLFEAVIHAMIDDVTANKVKFPILLRFLDDISFENPLTESTNRTLLLLNNGYTIDEIAIARSLKKNTIEDHIVEIAMNLSQFSIDRFVTDEDQQEICNVLNNKKTRSLKEIKADLKKDISYFAIRLTIARKGNEHGS